MIRCHHFLRFFLRIWSICCMLARQINLNNMEKEEPIIHRVYRKSLNYGATVVSVVSYAFVTVVPPRMSRSFHGHCHTRSMVMERPCPPRWNKCVNTCCHNCSCSLTIYVDYMQANSLSRSDIANKLGVSPQYVSRILSGNTNFSFKSVAEIERKLGISCMETAMT